MSGAEVETSKVRERNTGIQVKRNEEHQDGLEPRASRGERRSHSLSNLLQEMHSVALLKRYPDSTVPLDLI